VNQKIHSKIVDIIDGIKSDYWRQRAAWLYERIPQIFCFHKYVEASGGLYCEKCNNWKDAPIPKGGKEWVTVS